MCGPVNAIDKEAATYRRGLSLPPAMAYFGSQTAEIQSVARIGLP
jgi:hypothetical protein